MSLSAPRQSGHRFPWRARQEQWYRPAWTTPRIQGTFLGDSLKPLTVDEFLAWERAQDLRYEFDGTQPVAMTGGTSRTTV